MFKVLVNFNHVPDLELLGDNYLVYDRSDSKSYVQHLDPKKVIHTENKGNVDYDKLSYLVDNYETLPEVFLWGKTNLFKFITPEEYNLVKDNQTFTPLLTQHHATYSDSRSQVCYYSGGMYHERNDSWYVNELDYRISTFREFSNLFQIPCPNYIPFAPGGSYILTRDVVHRYSRDFYDSIRSVLPYSRNPAEAHMAERSYFLLWQ